MKAVRYLLAAVVTLLFLLLLFMIAVAGDTLLSLWQRLQDAPWYVGTLFALLLLAFAAAGLLVIWKLLRPATRKPPAAQIVDEDTLRERLARAESQGLDVAAASTELENLRQRRSAGKLYISLFGTISTGKSSLIAALLPDARPETQVTGGTTAELVEYHWQTPGGDEIILYDMPGLNEAGDDRLAQLARDEALRSHIVVYVCDGDLTATQQRELEQLASLHKPIIIALNKVDWYTDSERQQIIERLRQRSSALDDVAVVSITTGSSERVVVQHADGREEQQLRSRTPDISQLARALQRRIDEDPQRLEALRDSAVFSLAARALDAAEMRDRQRRGEILVRNHTRSAVVGALAAISPGTDILIQGALGVSLVKSLCSLYDVPVSQLEIDRLLQLGQSRINKHIAVLMAVLGNALKAFPGLGTLAGGALHAVTYGMVFDALGRSLNETLASRGELAPLPVINRFSETLGDQLEKRTGEMVRLVLETKKPRD